MSDDKLDLVVSRAVDDLARGDTRKAKYRLRSVLQLEPDNQAALTLLGRIYYDHGDYRNAMVYWSQAGVWDDDARTACRKLFAVTARALNNRNTRMAMYYLQAFDCAKMPDDLLERLDALQTAHYSLVRMESRQMIRACGPQCGGIMLALIGISTLALGLGKQWFVMMGVLALMTTAIVSTVNAMSHFVAFLRFKGAMSRAAELAHHNRRSGQ
jgi:tetratricopeptide (TPR) repeat protein